MTSRKQSLKSQPSSNVKDTNCRFSFLAHDVLVFLSYFLNNFLFNCYSHIVTKTFFIVVHCVCNLNKLNFDFINKWLEFLVSFFVVYTWVNKLSSNFDGYAFHHFFYYNYRIINLRETLSRVLGTLCSSGLFGYLYYRVFNLETTSYSSTLKKTLYNMLDSKTSLTILESLVYPHVQKEKRHFFLKKFMSKVLFLPYLKYEDRYYELLEKYLALLFECFLVELSFSLFVYTLSYLIMKSKSSPKANFALSTFVRTVFVTCGNYFLNKVDGRITLDESKWVFAFFGEGNVVFLFVRLTANLLGAFLVPVLLPMPTIMTLYEYKELYPNSELETKSYKSEFSYSYYVESKGSGRRNVNYTEWPPSKVGKLFSKIDRYLTNKDTTKSS